MIQSPSPKGPASNGASDAMKTWSDARRQIWSCPGAAGEPFADLLAANVAVWDATARQPFGAADCAFQQPGMIVTVTPSRIQPEAARTE